MADECGCKLRYSEAPLPPKIDYCPLHAEAENMRAALQEIERECNGHLGWSASAARDDIHAFIGSLGTRARKAAARGAAA